MRRFMLMLLVVCILSQWTLQQTDYPIISLNKPVKVILDTDDSLHTQYELVFNDAQGTGTDKWYLFADAAMADKYVWQWAKITFYNVDSLGRRNVIKTCTGGKGIEVCLLGNNKFVPRKDRILIGVDCFHKCQLDLVVTLSASAPLKVDMKYNLDFGEFAYAKLFTLNTTGLIADELRIVLQSNNLLDSSIPLRLLVNKGTEVPTERDHDFTSLHLWNDGQGLFLLHPENIGVFTILVEGPIKNALILETSALNSTNSRNIPETLPYFDYLSKSQKRSYCLIPSPKIPLSALKLVTFAGKISMNGLSDGKGVAIPYQPATFMSSSSQTDYNFGDDFFKSYSKYDLTTLCFRFEASQDSTFLLQYSVYYTKVRILSPELAQNAQLIDMKAQHIYAIDMFDLHNVSNEDHIIDLILEVSSLKAVNLKFEQCRLNQTEKCADVLPALVRQQKPLFARQEENILHYRFKINRIDFIEYTGTIDKYILLVKVSMAIQSDHLVYIIKYVDEDRVLSLAEDTVHRARVAIGEKKFYKFTNIHKDIVKAVVHITPISGQINYYGTIEDPRYMTDINQNQVESRWQTIFFNQMKPKSASYVTIQGLENAYFSISAQLIRSSEQIFPNRPSNGQGFNELILSPSIVYDFVIKSKEKIIFQLKSTAPKIHFQIKASRPLQLCMTEDIKSPPFEPNCEVKQELLSTLQESIILDKGLIANIGIVNNNDNNVSLSVEYSPEGEPCKLLHFGKMQPFKVKTNGSLCFTYKLEKLQDIEILIQTETQDNFLNLFATGRIDEAEPIIFSRPHLALAEGQLAQSCPDPKKICELNVKVDAFADTSFSIIAQKLDGIIYLLDGTPFRLQGVMLRPYPRQFVYRVINKKATTILIENKIGYYNFFGKIVEETDFIAGKTTFPTEKDFNFSSLEMYFNLYKTYTLEINHFKDCTHCIVLVSVQLTDNAQVQERGFFLIEVTQQNRVLLPNHPLVGHLEKRQMAFFEYEHRTNGTIYVTISNQHKNCANIYLSKNVSVKATLTSNDAHSTGTDLVYEGAPKGIYSVSLEATSDCPYSVQASSSKEDIRRISKGVYVDCQLKSNETDYFIFKNYINSSFKVMFLHQSGNVLLSVKRIDNSKMTDFMNDFSPTIRFSYAWSGQDVVKIEANSTDFQVDSYYFIEVKALGDARGSLTVPTPEVGISLITDSYAKDLLLAGESTKFKLFTTSKATFEIYVQYGQINLKASRSDNKTFSYNKTFGVTTQPVKEIISFAESDKLTFDYLRYSSVIVEAKKDTLYVFHLLSDDNNPSIIAGYVLKDGIPEFLMLMPNKERCYTGTFSDPKEQFLISFDDDSRNQTKDIAFTLTVKEKKVALKKDIYRGQMTLAPESSYQSQPFTLCATSPTSITITLIQSSYVVYLPQHFSMFVEKEKNMTFNSYGQVIIEVDECKGHALVLASSTFNRMATSVSEVKQHRRQQNTYEISYYGPVFVNVKLSGGTVQWFHKKEDKQIGIGYDIYESGSIYWRKQTKGLSVIVYPLRFIQPAKAKAESKIVVKEIVYTLVLAPTINQLESYINCPTADPAIFVETFTIIKGFQVEQGTFKIELQYLEQFFGKEDMFHVGVLATLKQEVASTKSEKYRFMYSSQQVFMDYFRSQSLIEVDQLSHTPWYVTISNFIVVLFGIVVAIVALIAFYKRALTYWSRRSRGALSHSSHTGNEVEFASLN